MILAKSLLFELRLRLNKAKKCQQQSIVLYQSNRRSQVSARFIFPIIRCSHRGYLPSSSLNRVDVAVGHQSASSPAAFDGAAVRAAAQHIPKISYYCTIESNDQLYAYTESNVSYLFSVQFLVYVVSI